MDSTISRVGLPAQAKEREALVKKLDYDRDVISLCLRCVTDKR
jgi:hypothetical protein